MRTEHRFDLSEFDPKATQFDLMVDAPKVLQRAIVPPTAQVPGSIKLRIGVVRKGIGHKSFGGQIWAIQIASG
jgi:hypothetical protein